MTPTLIIAAAIFDADPKQAMGPAAVAQVATRALTDDQIVLAAIKALSANGWADVIGVTSLEAVARTVLGSVGAS